MGYDKRVESLFREFLTMCNGRTPHRVKVAGIILLILGVLHVPLPQPDYHSLSHHDNCDGEVCAHHNHLLRWHAGIEAPTEESAVFHWHWVWPGHEQQNHDSDGSSLPVAHAHNEEGWVEPAFTPSAPGVSAQRLSVRDLTSKHLASTWFETWIPTKAALEWNDLPSLSDTARIVWIRASLQRWDC